MSESFYERLGVAENVSGTALRGAYAKQLERVRLRREKVVEQRGDPSQLDYTRTRLEEAWRVLGDPVARKRYDAMLAWCGEPDPPKSPQALWSFMVPWVTDPTSAVAVKLLREMTGLRRLRDLPLSPLPPSEGPTVVPLPTAESSGSGPHLQVVDGTPEATQVLRMFENSGSSSLISTEDLSDLIASLGYCGALLREVRERKGLSMQDVVDQTAIPEKYLDALEHDARQKLPGAAIFVEGYLRTVADVLGLEPTPLARGYLAHLEDRIDTEPDSA
jgi:hypothetical protein